MIPGADKVGDFGIYLAHKCTSVVFDPLSKLIMRTVWSKVTGDGNGAFFQRPLHVDQVFWNRWNVSIQIVTPKVPVQPE